MLGGRDFVVVLLDHRAHLRHRREHFAAHVLRRILRRHREVAALGAHAVAEVAALVGGIGIGGQFDRIDLEAGVVGLGREAHVVEYEELGLGAEEYRVADAGRLEIGLGFLGDAARIAVIGLAAGGIENVAVDDHRRGREERVHAGRGRVGHQRHVGLVDRPPTGDRGAVEHEPFRESVFVDQRLVERDMLPLAPWIGEAEIDIFDVIVLDRLQDFLGGLHALPFLNDELAPPATDGRAPSSARNAFNRVRAGLPGADADGFLDLRYKYLAIPDAPCLRGASDRLDRGAEIFVRYDDLDLHFGQKVDDVFGPPVKLGMALLPAEALRFEDSDPLDSRFLQGLLHLVELERLDDRFDLLHGPRASSSLQVGAADRMAFWRRGRASAAGGSIASEIGSRHRRPLNGHQGQNGRPRAPIQSAFCRLIGRTQTVGPHSPEPKIRQDVIPAFATTIRPDLAMATRWANTIG